MLKIHCLTLNYINRDNKLRVIHPTLIDCSGLLTLVDCGYNFTFNDLSKEFNRLKYDINNLSNVIITHFDHDHVGGLYDVLKNIPNVKVYSSIIDSTALVGKTDSFRFMQSLVLLNSDDEQEISRAKKFIGILNRVRPIDKVTVLKTNNVLPYCNNLMVLDTKGHTPGHISLYSKKDKTLITGDALVIYKEKLALAIPAYAWDLNEAKNSAIILSKLDIDRIICYHGGEITNNPKAQLLELVNSF